MENEQWTFTLDVSGYSKHDFVGNGSTSLQYCQKILKVPSNWGWKVNGKSVTDLNYTPKRGDHIYISAPEKE